MTFRDRTEAGLALAAALRGYAGQTNLFVLALPRGGVPVALQVATALGTPLDVFIVRKLGVPGHEELAMGAVASGGATVFNRDLMRRLRLPAGVVQDMVARESREVDRLERLFRGHRAPPDVAGRTVILVDDGLATGATMKAALAALRDGGADRLVVAAPVAAPETYSEFQREADAVICVSTPTPFLSVGSWYEDFSQVSDAEVRGLLNRFWRNHQTAADTAR